MTQLLKKYFPYLIFLIIGIVIASMLPKCGGSNITPQTDPNTVLKAKIKPEAKARDSLKKVTVKNDSVRIVEVIRWRQAKETIKYLPCDSAIKIIVHVCDTLITVDSTEITNLRKVIVQDSLIISNQFKVIRNDSIEALRLNKQVRKLKCRLWFWKAVTVGVAGYSVLRK